MPHACTTDCVAERSCEDVGREFKLKFGCINSSICAVLSACMDAMHARLEAGT